MSKDTEALRSTIRAIENRGKQLKLLQEAIGEASRQWTKEAESKPGFANVVRVLNMESKAMIKAIEANKASSHAVNGLERFIEDRIGQKFAAMNQGSDFWQTGPRPRGRSR